MSGLVLFVAAFVGAAFYHLISSGVAYLVKVERARRRARHHLQAMRAHIERNATAECGACGRPLGEHQAALAPFPIPGAYARCPNKPAIPVSIVTHHAAPGRN